MTILLAENIPMEFVRVPAGEFLMGGDKRKDPLAIEDELPQHKVYLSDYWIGSCPVTVAQFSAFIKTSGYRCQAETNPSLEDHPVTNVAWNDANAFCNWVTRLTQASGRQACMIRLPTEAEWENAARGTDGCLYPWGNQAPDASLCNYDDQVGMTTPVGLYSPQGNSTYGCVDLAGNVWEWTQDWYDAAYYQHSTATNPAGPDSGQYRVLRGGSWHNNDRSVRAAHRSRRTPNGRENNIGFRCVASSL
jgi:formylglycine-generating enzyme required for sulfatase activity